MLLPQLREEVCRLHAELPKNNLVAWTSGNISARDPATDLIVIKPSGLRFEDLTPASMVVTDLDGRSLDGDLAPSSDTASHCYIYRHMPNVHGIVHTHSRYATAFAVVGEPIPCVTTAMADEFGGEIPCCDFGLIGGEEIGKLVVDKLTGHRSPATLLQNHGVFTTGDSGSGGQSGGHDRGQCRNRLDCATTRRHHPDLTSGYHSLYAAIRMSMGSADHSPQRQRAKWCATLLRPERYPQMRFGAIDIELKHRTALD